MVNDMIDDMNGVTSCSGDCSDCGSDCGSGLDLSQPTVTLTLDDDSEVVCAIINIFKAGDNQYIALLPLDKNGQNEDGEVYLYRYYEDENGNQNLDNIETDEEYEIVCDAFDELLDSLQFQELEGIVSEKE